MKKNILRISVGVVVVILVGIAWLWATAPSLPPGTDGAIDEALAAELPELVTGATGMATSGDVDIWYERMAPAGPPTGTVVLVMGMGATALNWPPHFYQPLVDAGYEVVRFDNRGVGMSDWIEDWDAENPYTLEDMARDAIAVFDELQIERAHVVGVSMGGMIAQRLAISHRDRISSLTSISSTGYIADPELPDLATPFGRAFTRLILRYGLLPGERNQYRIGVGLVEMLRGEAGPPFDVRDAVVLARYEATRRRGSNPGAINQQVAAVEASGSRYDELGDISAPTLVVHGPADPIIHVAHAETYAPMIPGAELMLIDGLGHLLPPEHTPRMIDAMLRLFVVAEADHELR